MYTCDQCGYNTKIKCNYTRHLNKKFPCVPFVSEKVNQDPEKVNQNSGKVNQISEKVTQKSKNVNPLCYEITNNTTHVRCIECDKMLMKRNFKSHLDVCKGVSSTTCEYCFQTFASKQSKYKHRKVCKQRESYKHNENTPLSIGTQNNNNCNNTTTNNNIDSHDTTINNTNNTVNNIVVNQFNKEDFTGLVNKLKTEFAGMLADVLKSSVDDRMITLTRQATATHQVY